MKKNLLSLVLIFVSIAFGGIMDNSPVARQMYYSLMKYIASDSLKPEYTLSFEMIDEISINL